MMEKKQMRRILIASLVGSSIEWFDYFLYGTVAALVFNQLFFVNEDPTIGLLLSYASFALAFFIRPFGGVIFSHIGDRIGRKKTLVITLSLMGSQHLGWGSSYVSSRWYLGADFINHVALSSRSRNWR